MHPYTFPSRPEARQHHSSAGFPIFEDGTFAWVNLTADAVSPTPPGADSDTALRSIFADAPVAAVRQVLLRGYADQPVGLVDEFTLDVPDQALQFMLQPVTEAQTIIHARLRGAVKPAERMMILRRHNALMSAKRDHAEAAA